MMKERITELLQALERVKRNGELRQQQQEEVIADLKRTNRWGGINVIIHCVQYFS